MKIVIAPDSFKGSLSAVDAARIIKEAALECFPDARVACMPIADGGEGTLDALLTAMGGEKVSVSVTGPLGEAVSASYVRLPDGGAAVEMAAASGLPMVPEERRDPRYTTSRGTGELIRAALEAGADRVLVGLGGSATNDGGMGLLSALGARFFDAEGNALAGMGADLIKVKKCDLTGFMKGNITALCDVRNPLLGENGATFVYGPQKGAVPAIRDELEAGMENYARVMARLPGTGRADMPGAGAAGGAGFALGAVLGAELLPGIDTILKLYNFETACADADLVITGEGRIDRTSVECGKAVGSIAEVCGRRNVPLMVLSGSLTQDWRSLMKTCRASVMPLPCGCMPLSEAMEKAAPLLRDAAVRALKMMELGFKL